MPDKIKQPPLPQTKGAPGPKPTPKPRTGSTKK